MAGGKGDPLDWGGRPRSSGNVGQRLAHVPNPAKTQAEGLGSWGAGWGPGPCGHRRGLFLPRPPCAGRLPPAASLPAPALSAQAPFHQCPRPGAEQRRGLPSSPRCSPRPGLRRARSRALGAAAASRPLSEPLSAPGFRPALAPRSARPLALRPSPRAVPDLPRHHPHSIRRKRACLFALSSSELLRDKMWKDAKKSGSRRDPGSSPSLASCELQDFGM